MPEAIVAVSVMSATRPFVVATRLAGRGRVVAVLLADTLLAASSRLPVLSATGGGSRRVGSVRRGPRLRYRRGRR